jgi:hypothetical protein
MMRRALIAAALVTLAAAAGAEPLDVSIRPVDRFALAGAEPVALEFLGGFEMSAEHPGFGGFSGIQVDGDSAFLVSDSGDFVRARFVYEDGRLVGLAETEIDELFPDAAATKKSGDVEDIAFNPSDPSHGVVVRERQANAMLSFEMAGDRPGSFEPKTVGADNRILRSNKGLESVAYAPPASPAAGEIIAVAERPPRGAEMIPGWIAGVGAFSIVPHDGFDVSSARFLADGDLILLERRYTPGWGIAMRLRRIDGAGLAPGAVLDGPYLLNAGMTYQIDNMEGLSVHQDAVGRTILTLVSDDNFSILQRTLVLQFALAED